MKLIHDYKTFKFQCTASGESGEISLPAPRPVAEGKSLGLGQFPSKPFMVETPVKATIWKYSRALRWIVIVQVRWPFICSVVFCMRLGTTHSIFRSLPVGRMG